MVVEPPKPEYRNNDENPKRGDDIHIKLPWFEYNGSGRILSMLLIAVALFVSSIGTAALLVWHHRQVDVEHTSLIDAIVANACVNLLDMQEKKEFRQSGRYCGAIRSAERIRERFTN